MAHLTGLLCRKARNVLKWNQRELAMHCNVKVDKINAFERGAGHLHASELKDISKVLEREGIVFTDNGEVKLDQEARRKNKRTSKSDSGDSHTSTGGKGGQGEKVVLTQEDMMQYYSETKSDEAGTGEPRRRKP